MSKSPERDIIYIDSLASESTKPFWQNLATEDLTILYNVKGILSKICDNLAVREVVAYCPASGMVTVAGKGRPVSEIDHLFNLIERLTEGKYRKQAILPFPPQAIIERLYSLNYSSIEQAIDDSVERVKVNFYNILTLFTRYGMQLNDDVKDCLESNIVNYVILDLLNCQEEVLKWSSAYYLAKNLDQEKFRSLPKAVSWKTNKRTFLGNLENLLIRFSHTGIDFCWSWNALKRGCAPLRFNNVVKSVRTHMTTLGQEKITDQDTLWEIEWITKKIFKKNKNKNKLNSNFTVPTPSLNAGFMAYASKPKGGNRQYIKYLLESEVEDYQNQHGSDWTNGLMPAVGSVSIDIGKRVNMYDEESFWSEKGIDLENIHPSSDGFVVYVEPDISGPQTVSNISDTSLFGLLESSVQRVTVAKASVVALREPFKVRIITKSDSEVNYYGIPLQKKLHNILREMDTFQLIGTPLTLDIIQRHYGVIPDTHLVVSGDYSAATDNIHTDASLAALNSILELMEISESSKRVLRMTMQGQTLSYDNVFTSYVKTDPTYPLDLKKLESLKKKDRKPDHYKQVASLKEKYGIPCGWIVQERGQLMGSILSFPILCLLNYIMFEIAYLEFQDLYPDHPDAQLKKCSPKEFTKAFGLLINGDDISFHASQLLIDVWSKTFPKIGLTESVGKNFVCRNKLTINSKMYVMERRGSNICSWTERKMFNGGLCFASWNHVAELDYRRKVDLVKSLPAIQRDFLRTPEGGRDDFAVFDNTAFGFWNLDFLKTVPSVINWFVPTICGGLGLTTHENVSWTKSQIRVATQALTRSSPAELRQFKVLTDKTPLPQVTQLLLRVIGDISDMYLEPTVELGVMDDEDDLTIAFMAIDVFKNTLSESTLETLNNYTDKEYKKYIKGIKKRFNKLVSYNSLNDISETTQKELNLGVKPLPAIVLKKDYTITKIEDTVNYAK